ncbi:MAG: Fur family transcriptional regulator [Campylobacteraceae bacterium]
MQNKIKEFFLENDIKHTIAREKILEVLYEAKKPLSFEQIKPLLKVEMDKATFYRNISLFEESGVINKFEADDKKWYFELITSAHAHFICESCHNVICMDFAVGKNLKDYIVKNVLLKGICKNCQQVI